MTVDTRAVSQRLGTLFRPAQPAVPAWMLLVGLVAGTATSLVRQPGTGALDTIWAEDGTIFLADAVRPGFWDPIWEPYAGYVHVVPRVLAEVAALFPLSWSAAVLAIEAALLTAAMAVLVFHVSSTHLTGLVPRLAASAPVVVLPLGQSDLPNSIANLHWPALYVAFWVLLWLPARTAGLLLSAVVLGLTAGSDLLVVLFLPLAVARVVLLRTRVAWTPVLGLAAGLAVQVLVRLLNDASRELEPELNPLRLGSAVVTRLVPVSVLGDRWVGEPGAYLGFLVAAALAWAVVAAVLWVAARRPAERQTFAVVAAGHAVALYLLPCMASGVFTPRYAAAPAMLLVAAAASLLSGPAPDEGARRAEGPARLVAVLSCCLLVVVAAGNLRVGNERAKGPSWEDTVGTARDTRCSGESATLLLPVSPEGWTVEIPCREVRR